MTQNQLVDTLVQNFPGSHWSITSLQNEVTYDDLVWLDDPATKPTAAQLGF